MKWITRERPKIDRLACPWLIKRFIDPEAEFLYVPSPDVIKISQQINAIPFDVPDVKFTHYGSQCTFDCLVKEYKLKDPAIHTLANIVRGADTDRHEFAAECAGLWAISAGLAYNVEDDLQLLSKGMDIYDALYSWAKHLQNEKHTQNPEHLLLNVFRQYIHQKSGTGKKTPAWAKTLKEMLQDQVDTNPTFNLKEISKELHVHPAYLSREFSKYFDDLTFGNYIRKLRIEKAIDLLHSSPYALVEIAYLTGFSDQSHFTRIFKKVTGQNPSSYRKGIDKSKKSTKG